MRETDPWAYPPGACASQSRPITRVNIFIKVVAGPLLSLAKEDFDLAEVDLPDVKKL
jgi:hypothetical protein